MTHATSSRAMRSLTVGALGVVFGDIGSSPLYALRQCFTSPGGVTLTHANVLGVLSLIFWALISYGSQWLSRECSAQRCSSATASSRRPFPY